MYNYEKNNQSNAKKLRKQMTNSECKLWFNFLTTLPQKFYRQKMIGNYILDFYCPTKKIAIELDGDQHYEDNAIRYDNSRTEYLNSWGIEVLRFTNYDIKFYFEAVCQTIYNRLNGLD